MYRFAFHLLCSCLLLGIAAADQLPIETFFRHSQFSFMSLSPDGKYIAAAYSTNDHHILHITDLETGKRRLVQGGEVSSFTWLSDRRLMCYAAGRAVGGIVAINVDGTQQVVLVQPALDQFYHNWPYATVMELLQIVPAWTNSVLMEVAEVQVFSKRYPHPDVWRVNFYTGKGTLEEKNPGDVTDWLAANDGTVRAAIARTKDEIQLLYRASKQEPWKVVDKSKTQDQDVLPLAMATDNKHIYAGAYHGHDTLGLYLFDPDTKELGEPLWRDEQFDLHSASFTSKAKLAGVFFEADKLQLKAFDERAEKQHADVDAVLPGLINVPVSSSRSGEKVLYFSSSDRDPGSYYLVDNAKREFGIFARRCAWIKPEQMAAMRPVEYKARDGLTIHGYLTLPLTGDQKLPLVVIPHGGPNARDSWRFDSMVQFLANRGYAVLQMNFRGSTGYGLKFLRAGFKEWGGKMQDDITDGVKWAIAEGIADRDRIGIFGASYGGYAALMGLITTPELFKCAINYVGVTDVEAIARSSKRLRGEFETETGAVIRERVGDYRADQKHLDAISPVHLVEKIQAPILLAYGGRDPIVEIDQGRDLAKALKKKKKKFELIIEPNEGHGFYSEKALTNLFQHVEHFLKENL